MADSGEQGSDPVVLSRSVEDRLRRALQVALEETKIVSNTARNEGGPQTIATLKVQGAVFAIVKLQVQSTVNLSCRQREISILVARGLTNKEIAQKLRVCTPTVAAQLQRIFRKLDITTRAALAGMAPLFS